jgi:hypothetical protein
VARLDTARDAARSVDEFDQAYAQISLYDHLFRASASGGKNYRYCLTDHAYRIQLKSKTAKRMPLAVCQIASHFITSVGVVQAVDQLRLILSFFGTPESGANVSRIDLFCDFVWPGDLGALTAEAWVTRAKRKSQFWVGGQPSGWVIGEGALMARLYDKTLEIKKSGKTYLLPLWLAQGWDGVAPVYRLEFQLRTDALRELSASKYPAVLGNLGGLWRYCMEKWLRLTVPNPGDDTRSRWGTHPLWDELRITAWEGAGEASRTPVVFGRLPASQKLYAAFLSALTSFMGARAEPDIERAVALLLAEAKTHYDELGELKGEGFEGQAKTRAAIKAADYGVPFPGVTEEATRLQRKAVSDAYRKASGR